MYIDFYDYDDYDDNHPLGKSDIAPVILVTLFAFCPVAILVPFFVLTYGFEAGGDAIAQYLDELKLVNFPVIHAINTFIENMSLPMFAIFMIAIILLGYFFWDSIVDVISNLFLASLIYAIIPVKAIFYILLISGFIYSLIDIDNVKMIGEKNRAGDIFIHIYKIFISVSYLSWFTFIYVWKMIQGYDQDTQANVIVAAIVGCLIMVIVQSLPYIKINKGSKVTYVGCLCPVYLNKGDLSYIILKTIRSVSVVIVSGIVLYYAVLGKLENKAAFGFAIFLLIILICIFIKTVSSGKNKAAVVKTNAVIKTDGVNDVSTDTFSDDVEYSSEKGVLSFEEMAR